MTREGGEKREERRGEKYGRGGGKEGKKGEIQGKNIMTVCSFSSFGTTNSSSLEHEIMIVSEANVINMNIICDNLFVLMFIA